MKATSKIFALLICLLLLTGCGHISAGDRNAPDNTSAGADQNDPDGKTGVSSAPDDDPEEDFPTAADYYRFLKTEYAEKEQEAAEKGYLLSFKPAPTEAVEISIYKGDFMDKLSWNADLYGTISAIVEDFDGDGGLEMFVVGIDDVSVMDTRFGKVLYDEGAAYDPENRCFELTLRYYDETNGEITRIESNCVPFATLPMDGWGHMVVGMEKLDEQYVLYTYVYSENMSTYGPNYFEVINVPGGLEKYISAVSAYGLSEAEANKLIYRDEVWDISSTTLHDTYRTIVKVDGAQSNLDPAEEAYRDALGDGLVCFVNVAFPEWGGDKAVYTLTDYTNFSHYLENDAADWSAVKIPQGGKRETPEAPEMPSGLTAFISGIETAAGISFTSKGTEEENGIITVSLATAHNFLTVRWDAALDVPASIGWAANDTDTTQEWFDGKDAILSSPVFGWADGEADRLKGKVSWSDYAAGITIGNYSCLIGNVVGAGMSITRN